MGDYVRSNVLLNNCCFPKSDAISVSELGKRKKLQTLRFNLLGCMCMDVAVNWLFLSKTAMHMTDIFVNRPTFL